MKELFCEEKTENVNRYWMRLFPEKKKIEDIHDILNKLLGISVDSQGIFLKDDSFLHKFYAYDAGNRYLYIENKDKILPDNCDLWADALIDSIGLFNKEEKYKRILKNPSEFWDTVRLRIRRDIIGTSYRTLLFESNYKRENKDTTPIEYATFFSEYEELFRLCKERAEGYYRFITDILNDYLEDREKIKNRFGIKSGKIEKIDADMGDTHCGFKTVARVKFEESIVIYKPRDVSVDVAFNKLIKLVNGKWNMKYKLKYADVLDRGSHGWFEFINSVNDEVDSGKYFHMVGQLLFLLYMLNATDMHYENIIACNGEPYLVDLETIFTGGLFDYEKSDNKCAVLKVKEKIEQSVNRTGLLPLNIKIGERKLDVGGVTGKSDQVSPIRSIRIKDGSNGPEIEYYYPTIEGKNNIPKAVSDVTEFTPNIVEGFKDGYNNFLRHRKSGITAIEKVFADTKIRVVVKPTMLYGNLLSISLHPDYLRTPADRSILLSRVLLGKERNETIAVDEVEQMMDGQIPYYYMKFESNNLYEGMHDSAIFKCDVSPKEFWKVKLDSLNKEDMAAQIEIIRSSLFSIRKRKDAILLKSEKFENNKKAVLKEIEKRIASRSLTDDAQTERCYWGSSVQLVEDDNWNCTIDGIDMYDGNAGTALFYTVLYKKTGKEEYREKAAQTLAPVLVAIKESDEKFNTGFLKGVGGFLAVLYEMRGYCIPADKADEAIDAILAKEDLNSDEDDFVLGNAGYLAALSRAYNIEKSPKRKIKILEVAEKYADIITGRTCFEQSGFAHGINGIIPYVYRFYKLLRKPKYLEYVTAAIEYERTHYFIEKDEDWRCGTENGNYAYAWCHGSPGILLGKLMLAKLGYKDALLEKEMTAAKENLLKKGLGHGLCLCHGDLGNAMIYKAWAKEYGTVYDLKRLNKIEESLLGCLLEGTWDNEEKSCNRFNGLMIGLSGIGLFLATLDSETTLTDRLL